jgi:hypothetical protein
MVLEYHVRVKDLEKLSEGSWLKWSWEMEFSFLEAGLMGYINGSIDELADQK